MYEKAAYQYAQIVNAEATTQQAELESRALAEEIAYWANASDRNYTDDEILGKIDWSKYKTLQKMQSGDVSLNRSVKGYNEDWARGYLWSLRNNGGTGNTYLDRAMAEIGEGNQWVENKTLRDKLDPNSPNYSPYSVGSTLEDERLYFGVDSFDQKWIDDNRAYMVNADAKTQQMYNNVIKAEARTQKLEEELKYMNADIDYYLQYTSDPERIISWIKEGKSLTSQKDGKSVSFSDLFYLDETLKFVGDNALVGTTRAVDYSWNDIEMKIRQMCEEKKNGPTTSETASSTLNDLTVAPRAYQNANRKEHAQAILDNNQEESGKNEEAQQQAEEPVQTEAPVQDDVIEENETPDALLQNDSIEENGTQDALQQNDQEPKLDIPQVEDPNKYQPAPELVEKEKAERENLNNNAEMVLNNGTPVEQSIYRLAGGTTFQSFADAYTTARARIDACMNSNQESINSTFNANRYLEGLRITTAYDAQQNSLDKAEEQLDKILPEYTSLEERGGAIEEMGLSPATAKLGIINLQNLTEDKDIMDDARQQVESGNYDPQTMAYIYSQAHPVSGYGISAMQLLRGTSEEEYRKNMEDTKAMMEYMVNGFPEGLDDFTQEDVDRMAELRGLKNELEKQIDDANTYLEENKDSYDRAMTDKNKLAIDVAEVEMSALKNGSEVSADLYSGMDLLYQYAANPNVPIYSSYTIFDEAVNSEEITKEDAHAYALASAMSYLNEAAKLESTLEQLDKLGVTITDKERENIQKRIDYDKANALDAGYYTLSDNDDYESVVSSVRDELSKATFADSGKEGYSPILSLIADGTLKFTETDPKAYDKYAESKDDLLFHIMNTMTDEEKDNYLYLWKKDGPEAADQYLNRLCDPKTGMFRYRADDEARAKLYDAASTDGWSALGLGLLSFGVKFLGDIESTSYSIVSQIAGNYDPTSDKLKGPQYAAVMREGTKQWMRDNVADSEWVDRGLDAFYSAIDCVISSKASGVILDKVTEAMETTKWGSKLLGNMDTALEGLNGAGAKFFTKASQDLAHASYMGINAAAQQYNETYLKTNGDETKALAMALGTFFCETITEAVTMGNISDAFEKGFSRQTIAGNIKEFIGDLLKDSAEEFLGEASSEWMNQNWDRIIMDELSNYQETLDKYADYPPSVAKKLADKEMWGNILNAGIVGAISSGFSTSAGYVSGRVHGASEADTNTKDIALLEKGKTSNDAKNEAAIITSVIANGSIGNSTAMAASTSIMERYGQRTASSIVSGLLTASGDQQSETKASVAYAALTGGSGNAVLNQIAEKAQGGQPITMNDVATLFEAVRQDKSGENATTYEGQMSQAVKSARVAKRMADIMATTKFDKVDAAKKEAEAKQQNLEYSEGQLEDARNEAAAAGDNLLAAEENYDPRFPETAAALQQATNQAVGAQANAEGLEPTVEAARQNLEEARTNAEDVSRQATNEVRQQAEAEVNQEMQQENELAAQQQAAAEQAAAEQAAAQAEEDERSGATEERDAETTLRDSLAAKGITGEAADILVNRAMRRIEQRKNGNVDTSQDVASSDGQKVLGRMSRRIGVPIRFAETEEGVKGYYNRETGEIVLSNKLTIAQAVVETALHEMTHSLEQTDGYKTYAGIVRESYGDEWNDAVDRKIGEYKQKGKNLTRAEAEAELVADFARLHLNDKDTINRLVSSGLGGTIRNTLHNINQYLRNMKLHGEEKTQAENLRRAERALRVAMKERGKQETQHGQNAQQNLMDTGTELTDADIDQMLEDTNQDYMSAVERGDEEAAAQDVESYAVEKGYTDKAYHGSDSFGFTQFDLDAGQGTIFVAYDENVAGTYTKDPTIRNLNVDKGIDEGVYQLYTRPGKQLVVEAGDNNWNSIPFNTKNAEVSIDENGVYEYWLEPDEQERYDELELDYPSANTREIAKWAKEHGYNSVRINGVYDNGGIGNQNGIETGHGDIGIFFNQDDVKSADTITYDDNGNVIPLNERFTSNADIRYSTETSNNDEMTDADMDQLLVNLGLIPAFNVEQPGTKYRQFGRKTVQGSDAVHGEVQDYLYNHSEYTPDSNQEQINRAIEWVREKRNTADPDGFNAAVDEVTNEGFDYRSADGQARMLTVMSMAAMKAQQAEASGDIAARNAYVGIEMRLADAYNKQGTDLGRQLQARKIFRLMTPLGRMSYMQKLTDDINTDYAKKGKSTRVHLSEDTMNEVANADTEEKMDKARKRVDKELAAQMPADPKEKLRAYRMTSMLANPRTHIRNILGNFLFEPAVGLKNKLGATSELLVQGIENVRAKITGTEAKQLERTKTLRPWLSKDVRDFAREDAKNMESVLRGESKYNEESQIQKERKAFGQGNSLISKTLGRAFQWLSDKNSNALEAEDWIFLKGHYRRALGGWMQANGYTAEQLQNDPSLLEKGRAYAVSEAQKATYRDFSQLASTLNEVSKKGGVAGFVVDAALPFKKTPANILKRGLEYSPLGIAKSITTDLYHLNQYMKAKKSGSEIIPDKAISPNQFIDNLCSGLSGSAIMAVGAILANMGVVSAGFDDDDEFGKQKGEQEYAIKIRIGDHDVTYTMDWAAPMSMPFFVGAALANQLQEGGEIDIESLTKAIGNIAEPVFNMSMLDGVNSLLRTNSYSEDDTVTQIGAKIGANYLSSLVPSALGAATRIYDPIRRKAYVESGKGSGVLGTFRYALEQAENKIPGMSETNIPYRNAWGEAQEDSQWKKAIENILSPGYFSEVKEDPIMDELERLYKNVDQSKKKSMIPTLPAKTLSVGGEKIPLTAEQYDQLTVERGQTAKQLLTDLMKTEYYQTLADEDRANVVKDVWTYATQNANRSINEDANMEAWVLNSRANPVQGIINRSKDAIDKEVKAGCKNAAIEAVKDGDIETMFTCIEKLREAGVKDPKQSVKTAIAGEFKEQYIRAYQDGERDIINEIESTLMGTGLFGPKDFLDWLNNMNKQIQEEDDMLNW